MRDLVVLLTTVAFFALCLAYVRWCDRIIGPDDVNEVIDPVDGVERSIEQDVAA